MSIYFKIKDIIAKKENLSISRLEKELQFGSGTIRRWQTNDPGLEKVLKVADYLNVSITELIPNIQPSPQANADDSILAIQERLNSLPEEERQHVIKDTIEFIDYQVMTLNQKGTED